MRTILAIIAIVLPATVMSVDDMEPYPPADSGFERFAFRVPEVGNEHDHKVEVVVGKVIPVDCNRSMFMGDAERLVVKGWGYPYYVVRKITGPATTLMACEDDARIEQFVPVRGDGFLLRYNHKLPIVVYVPGGFEVRYRVWSAAEELGKAQPE